MIIDFLLERFSQNRDRQAIVWQDQTFDYGWLLDHVREWQTKIAAEAVPPGAVVILEADFSPDAVALFLALAGQGCILVPLTSSVAAKKDEFIDIAAGEICFAVDAHDHVSVRRTGRLANHEFYARLRDQQHPGLVLFSSGSTGKSKAVVHDLAMLLQKFQVPRHCLRTLTFLLFDHIGGVNTMLYVLSNAGCMVTVQDRNPDAVLAAVAKYQVELLPTSPTFINLVLLSEAWQRHDLRSLKTVTYGTEPMPESTLKQFHKLLPNITLLQTYGLSEVGILRSQSKSSDSLWVRVGGEGFETRVIDGALQIKARSAMLGYLNAPSPFTPDGWLNTGDLVEVDGEYIRFLGRRSEVINVGGQKVFPPEVESVIQEIDNVAGVCVYGKVNPITGQIVCADVTLKVPEETKAFVARLKQYCRQKLQDFKVPVKVRIVTTALHSERFKKTPEIFAMNQISPKAQIGRNVLIGEFSIIGDNVQIGDDTIIGSHCHLGCPSPAANGQPLVIGPQSNIRSHCVLYEGSTFGAGLSTGHGVLVREKTRAGLYLQLGSQTDVEGDCQIGDFVKMHSEVHVAQKSQIGHFVFLHPRVQFTNDPFPPSFLTKGITIKDMAVVCTGSLLMPGITIGLGGFVAAASVVKADVPDVHCVAGNPATVFSRLDQFFHPTYGQYHPWVRRFRDKYPPLCTPLMEQILARLDQRLAQYHREDKPAGAP